MQIVIGVHGVKRSGKDTVGDMIGEYCQKRRIPFQRLAFADEIRHLIMETMPERFRGIISMEDLKGVGKIDRDKDNIFDMAGVVGYDHFEYVVEWINAFIERIKEKHGYELTSYITEMPSIVTIRDMLVIFGTEIGRDIFFYDIWLDIVKRQYENFEGVTTITDVRFDNEAQLIRESKGRIVRVSKEGLASTGGHRSEQGISNHLVDWDIINVHGKLDELQNDVIDYMRLLNV